MIECIKKESISGISSSTLKILAIISMLIDHISFTLIMPIAMKSDNISLLNMSILMRVIGRIAFPIFCFFIVEGVIKTKNIKKYIARMFVFAIISEIPFDLAMTGRLIDFRVQNVFFTLMLGVVLVYFMERILSKDSSFFIRVIKVVLLIALFSSISYFLKSDYSYKGVCSIAVMYLLRKNKLISIISGCLVLASLSSLGIFSLISAIFIKFYNGQRGIEKKYVFYLFYPFHLTTLYLISVLII